MLILNALILFLDKIEPCKQIPCNRAWSFFPLAYPVTLNTVHIKPDVEKKREYKWKITSCKVQESPQFRGNLCDGKQVVCTYIT